MLTAIISKLSVFPPLLGIYIGFRGRSRLSKPVRLIFILMIISFVVDVIVMIMANYKINNLMVIHLFNLIQAIIFILFFREMFPEHVMSLNGILIAFIIFYVGDSIFITGLLKPNAISMIVQSFLMIALSIAYFYRVYVHETDIFIDKSPDFLIVLGILFYFTGAFFSWLLSSDILNTSISSDKFYGSWILHNIANIVKNIIFALALWRAQKT